MEATDKTTAKYIYIYISVIYQNGKEIKPSY